jgi:hypothetical protein
VLRTALTAATSEDEVPVPLKRSTGSDAGIGGGNPAVICPLRDPHPVKVSTATREATTRINRGVIATRLIQKRTKSVSDSPTFIIAAAKESRGLPVVDQFNDATPKALNHQGHEVSRRLLVSGVSFVYLRGLGG